MAAKGEDMPQDDPDSADSCGSGVGPSDDEPEDPAPQVSLRLCSS